MNWYYVSNGQQAGPVEDAQLAQLVTSGAILADTLVWHEGMPNWQPYGQIQAASVRLATAPPVMAGGPPVAYGEEGVCAECNRIFNKQDLIAYSGVYVCAACKPIFLQRLSEGARVSGTMTYAGFWIRVGAKLIDGIIMRVVGTIIGVVIGLGMRSTSEDAALAAQLTAGLVGFLLGMAYEVFFNGKFGATPGKMACKIKIVEPDGRPITYGKAFGRFWAEMLSGLTLCIGYMMAGWDSEKRALHDRVCNTRVIYK